MTEGLDRFIGEAGIRTANRLSRRSFIGRVGATSVGLATAGLVVGVDSAEALCAGESITCRQLTGNNGCASGDCYDGGWTVPNNSCDAATQCGSNTTTWHDCCKRRSVCGCSYPQGLPSCCNDCVWNNQYQGAPWCGDGSQTQWVVRCRWYSC